MRARQIVFTVRVKLQPHLSLRIDALDPRSTAFLQANKILSHPTNMLSKATFNLSSSSRVLTHAPWLCSCRATSSCCWKRKGKFHESLPWFVNRVEERKQERRNSDDDIDSDDDGSSRSSEERRQVPAIDSKRKTRKMKNLLSFTTKLLFLLSDVVYWCIKNDFINFFAPFISNFRVLSRQRVFYSLIMEEKGSR